MSIIRIASLFAVVLVLVLSAQAQTPVGTAFTYQGRLEDAGMLANGLYDLRFILYNADSGGSQVGSTLTWRTSRSRTDSSP